MRTGDVVDGDPVTNVVFCEEGLNDAGRLAFVATLDDPDALDDFRQVVVRAVPTRLAVGYCRVPLAAAVSRLKATGARPNMPV